MRAYFNEAAATAPIATNLYPNADAMFDSHTYPKGSVVLHTLRRKLGDKRFFAGLHHYLDPVPPPTRRDARSLPRNERGDGRQLVPFFNQWLFKPGHPVLDFEWRYDDAAKQVVLTVRQTQDTADGTPVYDLNATVGLIRRWSTPPRAIPPLPGRPGGPPRAPARPDAVLLDLDHDFLRELPTLHWTAEGIAVHPEVRTECAGPRGGDAELLAGAPSDGAVEAVVASLRDVGSQFPALPSTSALANLRRADT